MAKPTLPEREWRIIELWRGDLLELLPPIPDAKTVALFRCSGLLIGSYEVTLDVRGMVNATGGVDAQNDSGRTLLHTVVRTDCVTYYPGRHGIIQILLAMKAHPLASDIFHSSPFVTAVKLAQHHAYSWRHLNTFFKFAEHITPDE